MNLNEVILGRGRNFAGGKTLIQIAPIKVNPWSSIAKAVGRAINSDVLEELKGLRRTWPTISALTENRTPMSTGAASCGSTTSYSGHSAYEGGVRGGPSRHRLL